MNNETQILIIELAEKLGTTTEYLWQVLIRQAHISAITSIIYCVLIYLVGYFLWKLHIYLYRKDKYNEALEVVMAIICVIYIVLLVCSLSMLGRVVDAFFNPEYWALEEALRILKY